MRTRTWEISDEFWALVEPLLPATRRDSERGYKRKPGGGRKAKYSDRLYFSGIVYVPRTRIIWNATHINLPRLPVFAGIARYRDGRNAYRFRQAQLCYRFFAGVGLAVMNHGSFEI